MKKIIKIVFSLFLVFVISFITKPIIKASADLDYIEKYDIIVNPLKDGSLDIEFDIVWRVLDGTSDGPLTWVKIGIPNFHAERITALTSNIKKIKYYSDSGSFIRIDFKDSYKTNDVVYFSFKYNQSYMYHLYNDTVIYDYNPGWFNDIKVGECSLSWNKEGISEVLNNNDYVEEDGYYVWRKALNYGERISIKLEYSKSFFDPLDEKKQYTDKYLTPFEMFMVIFSIVILTIVIITILIIHNLKKDPYLKDRGFIRGNYHPRMSYFPYFIYTRVDSKGRRVEQPNSSSASNGGSHGGGCACACACACAGGGRAGCSRKDIYHTNLQSKMIFKILNRKEK